jgi:hypothetical protein
MPDNLHPADDVQRLIAERFLESAFGGLIAGEPGS